MAANPVMTMVFDEGSLTVTLLESVAPETCSALVRQLPIKGEIVHAMWSGPLCLLRNQPLDGVRLENPTTFLVAGDVIYHPGHEQIGIAYAVTQFREPIGSVYVTLLGRVSSDLGEFVRVGGGLQRTGARTIELR